jgi:tRNA A37 threonylcarbamoyladenosine dehydratase
VGFGGVGSLMVEMFARSRIGELVLIDADRVDLTNRPD